MRSCKLILFFGCVAFGQEARDLTEKLEEAHRPMFQTGPEKSQTVSEVTSQVAGTTKDLAKQQAIKRWNFIDEHIFGRLERDRIPHASLSTDEEFVRRAYLDATGQIPPMTDILEFLTNDDPAKRSKLVDRLVDSEGFVTKWAFYFQDLFRAGGKMGFGLNLFHYWIREWLTLDRPYSDVVRELLTGTAKTSASSPGALYFARDYVRDKDDPKAPDAHDLVNISDTIDEFTITYNRVFLGVNLACISCHDGKHHLEKVNLYLSQMTRSQFFQQASFFGHTRMIMNWENAFIVTSEVTVDDMGKGYDTKALSGIRVPRTGESKDARFFLTGEAGTQGKLRDGLARMMTGHIQFSRAFANRIWSELMGIGVVEPVDDFDLARYEPDNPPPAPWTIQPSNPKLLDAMAKDFINNNYSFKHLVKTIMKSSAYQLSSRFSGFWKNEYASYYARKYVRMLTASELHDAVVLATGSADRIATGADKEPIVQSLADPSRVPKELDTFLTVFGHGNREQLPKKTSPSALQAMLMMQSKFVTERVLAKGGTRIQQLLALAPEDRLVADHVYRANLSHSPTQLELAAVVDRVFVDRIYLSTLSRHPDNNEMRVGVAAMDGDRVRGGENLQWALINSPEFMFNH